MLESSAEYLQALRKGSYLRFLEWPKFVAKHYLKNNAAQASDEITNLLVFEWLNNGFCEEDAKALALLCAVEKSESQPIRGEILFTLSMLSTVVIVCMTYESTHVMGQFLANEKLNEAQITKLMAANGNLAKATFEEHLLANQSKFFDWAETMDKSKILTATNQIMEIAQLRYLVAEYILVLRSTTSINEELKVARTSVVISLSGYLNEQMELNALVKETIAGYVEKIWQLEPGHAEQEFLNKLIPSSLWGNSWRFLAGFSRFFNTLELLPAASLTTKDQEHDTVRP